VKVVVVVASGVGVGVRGRGRHGWNGKMVPGAGVPVGGKVCMAGVGQGVAGKGKAQRVWCVQWVRWGVLCKWDRRGVCAEGSVGSGEARLCQPVGRHVARGMWGGGWGGNRRGQGCWPACGAGQVKQWQPGCLW